MKALRPGRGRSGNAHIVRPCPPAQADRPLSSEKALVIASIRTSAFREAVACTSLFELACFPSSVSSPPDLQSVEQRRKYETVIITCIVSQRRQLSISFSLPCNESDSDYPNPSQPEPRSFPVNSLQQNIGRCGCVGRPELDSSAADVSINFQQKLNYTSRKFIACLSRRSYRLSQLSAESVDKRNKSISTDESGECGRIT